MVGPPTVEWVMGNKKGAERGKIGLQEGRVQGEGCEGRSKEEEENACMSKGLTRGKIENTEFLFERQLFEKAA